MGPRAHRGGHFLVPPPPPPSASASASTSATHPPSFASATNANGQSATAAAERSGSETAGDRLYIKAKHQQSKALEKRKAAPEGCTFKPDISKNSKPGRRATAAEREEDKDQAVGKERFDCK